MYVNIVSVLHILVVGEKLPSKYAAKVSRSYISMSCVMPR